MVHNAPSVGLTLTFTMVCLTNGFRLTLPLVQNLIAGLVLFGIVGIYVAITALGAGGEKPTSTDIIYVISSTLYVVFAVTGFYGGSVINRFGLRRSVFVGDTKVPNSPEGFLVIEHFSN